MVWCIANLKLEKTPMHLSEGDIAVEKSTKHHQKYSYFIISIKDGCCLTITLENGRFHRFYDMKWISNNYWDRYII